MGRIAEKTSYQTGKAFSTRKGGVRLRKSFCGEKSPLLGDFTR